MDRILENNLANAFNELQQTLSNSYLELYSCTTNKRLQLVFSSLHNNIIECFKKMNERLPSTEKSNKHYLANYSRKLKTNIELALHLQKEFKNSELSFEIDKYYYNIFKQCLDFLENSGGSEIPLGMKKITIYEKISIFVLSNKINIPNILRSCTLTLIGSGSYANVYKYYDDFYQCQFALKRLNKAANDKEFIRFVKEYEIMRSVNNPYILKVYSMDEQKKEYIMEYADFTLEKYIKNYNQKLSNGERISLGCQVLKGIEILWNNNILHRDISFNNILLKLYDCIYPVIKISDFGLAKEINSDLTSIDTEIKGSLNDFSTLKIKGFNEYNIEDELYALTQVLYFIATGKENVKKANCDFLKKGIGEDKENRYKKLEDLKVDFISFLKAR